jgi:glycerol kinase
MIKNFTKNFTEYILSIDQGTTSTRLALINKNLQIKNIKQKEHNQIHKELNWTEHNPLELKDNIENIIKELHNENQKVKNKIKK